MAEAATKLPIKTPATSAPQVTTAPGWQPFEALRNQIDRLFHDFRAGFLQGPSRSLLDIEPSWRSDFGFEVTPATVIGFLTILGYSLYDTVVVFDKVRENTAGIAGGSRMTYSQAANLAVNQTLVRSINTSMLSTRESPGS